MARETFTKTERRLFLERLPDVAIGVVGFFLALMANSYFQSRAEKETYDVMREAVIQEAKANEDLVVGKLILQKAEGGLVVGDLRLGVISQSLGNPLFVKYAGSQLTNFENYLSIAVLANSYRSSLENAILSSAPEAFDPKTKTFSPWRANPQIEELKSRWRDTDRELLDTLKKVVYPGLK